jgi:lipopolysaccharide/colanic/teichoic acid biosynthesis glycosyltransferase
MLKRTFDLIVASLCLVASLPVALIIAAGIKLSSPGPALYAARRVGKGGRVFAHYRFRTMAGEPPRLTRFGRVIGNLTLDEIPALWNIVRGDLSLIGPRPAKPEEVNLADADWQEVISVRPGLCGLGLLTFLDRYNQTPVKERIRPDVYYVEHHSWRLDIQLLIMTLYRLLRMGHLKGKFWH